MGLDMAEVEKARKEQTEKMAEARTRAKEKKERIAEKKYEKEYRAAGGKVYYTIDPHTGRNLEDAQGTPIKFASKEEAQKVHTQLKEQHVAQKKYEEYLEAEKKAKSEEEIERKKAEVYEKLSKLSPQSKKMLELRTGIQMPYTPAQATSLGFISKREAVQYPEQMFFIPPTSLISAESMEKRYGPELEKIISEREKGIKEIPRVELLQQMSRLEQSKYEEQLKKEIWAEKLAASKLFGVPVYAGVVAYSKLFAETPQRALTSVIKGEAVGRGLRTQAKEFALTVEREAETGIGRVSLPFISWGIGKLEIEAGPIAPYLDPITAPLATGAEIATGIGLIKAPVVGKGIEVAWAGTGALAGYEYYKDPTPEKAAAAALSLGLYGLVKGTGLIGRLRYKPILAEAKSLYRKGKMTFAEYTGMKQYVTALKSVRKVQPPIKRIPLTKVISQAEHLKGLGPKKIGAIAAIIKRERGVIYGSVTRWLQGVKTTVRDIDVAFPTKMGARVKTSLSEFGKVIKKVRKEKGISAKYKLFGKEYMKLPESIEKSLARQKARTIIKELDVPELKLRGTTIVGPKGHVMDIKTLTYLKRTPYRSKIITTKEGYRITPLYEETIRSAYGLMEQHRIIKETERGVKGLKIEQARKLAELKEGLKGLGIERRFKAWQVKRGQIALEKFIRGEKFKLTPKQYAKQLEMTRQIKMVGGLEAEIGLRRINAWGAMQTGVKPAPIALRPTLPRTGIGAKIKSKIFGIKVPTRRTTLTHELLHFRHPKWTETRVLRMETKVKGFEFKAIPAWRRALLKVRTPRVSLKPQALEIRLRAVAGPEKVISKPPAPSYYYPAMKGPSYPLLTLPRPSEWKTKPPPKMVPYVPPVSREPTKPYPYEPTKPYQPPPTMKIPKTKPYAPVEKYKPPTPLIFRSEKYKYTPYTPEKLIYTPYKLLEQSDEIIIIKKEKKRKLFFPEEIIQEKPKFKSKRVFGRKYKYTPSLVGIELGEVIGQPPKGTLTGIGIRPVVSKKKIKKGGLIGF